MAAEVPSSFISYCRADSEFVLQLAEDLKAAGIAVWLDQMDIVPGEPWDQAVERALRNCPRVLVVLSPAAVSSSNVLDEVSFALKRKKTIIPVLHSACEIPFRLDRLQHIDFRTNYARGLRALLTMLSTGGEEFAIPASDKSQRVALKEQPEVAPERQRLLIETGGLTAVKIGHPDVRPSGEVQSRQAPAEAGIPRRRWGIALLLGIGVLVNYIDRVNLSVAQPALHAEFGITAVTFGWLLGAYSWTYALLQLPSGVLLDRFGVKLVGRVSTFLWSMASFAASISPGLAGFFGARLLLGVGEAPTFPASAKANGYWFPAQERTLATAFADAAAKLAPALGVPIVGLMMVKFGWRISFAATGLISLAYFGLFFRFYRNPSEDPHLSERERTFMNAGGALPEGVRGVPQKGASLGYLARQRRVIGLSIGFASYNYTFYLLLNWLPSYLSSAMHIDLLHSAFYTAVPWLVATFTDLLVGGWLVDALVQRGFNAVRVRRVVLVGGTALGMGILGAAYATTTAAAVFWISISIGGLAAAAPVGWSLPALISPRNSVGSVGGIVNFMSQLSAISAPVITGYVVKLTHSFAWAFGVAAIFLAIGITSYIVLLGNMTPVPEPA